MTKRFTRADALKWVPVTVMREQGVPGPLNDTLNLALFVSWINGMSLSRSQENHARFSEQWDVLEAYVQGVTQLSVESTTPEEMREMLARMAAPEEPENKTPNAGALSAEDLAALGVEG